MRIGFDARMITHPGIGRYIKCLLPELLRQRGRDEFVLFGNPEELRENGLGDGCRIVKWNAPIYSVWEQITCPFDSYDIDLVHVPHFNIPLRARKKMVVTIHDLIYILFPPPAVLPLARYYSRFMISSALARSGKVIAVSENTKKDILECFGREREKDIKVIYEAADPGIERVENGRVLEEARKKFGLSERIILYVGSVKPHKNIATLIKVYARLKLWGAPHQLVLAGRWDRKEDYLKNKLNDENVRYLGEVSTEDLRALYSLADVLLNLSFYEGFGLTLLEAMQCGVPVVTSDASSIPEVVGKAAYALPPGAVEQIANTVYNVLANKGLREGMVREGYKQVANFSWEKAARETLEVYRSVVK